MALRALCITAVCGGCTPAGESAAPAGALADAAPTQTKLDTAGWLTYSDAARGIAFRYPSELGTSYIHAVDWPPMLRVLADAFQCTEAGSETARAGRTERAQIAGRTYCVTRESEGAAGSIYTSYAYALEEDGRLAILTFSVRAVQCANYDEPRRSECDTERRAFDPNILADAVARTIELH
jgi:hypothetical protein